MAERFPKCDGKKLQELKEITNNAKKKRDISLRCRNKQEIAWFLWDIWDKYRLVIFQNSPNITRGIYPKYP